MDGFVCHKEKPLNKKVEGFLSLLTTTTYDSAIYDPTVTRLVLSCQ
jgi:hypothetical protein